MVAFTVRGGGRSLLAAAEREVDAYGLVRGACGAPTFDRAGTSAEAQAFHLLATAQLPPRSASEAVRG
ncbi:hypothetical protein Aab01nite_30840 [Paractinoplanes abujensis]|uniref:Uncharacterized protein n=1 Tax=Paractinoplanes abujensis TaxID=882441 RepID=A0A7W7D0I4_9ACTN|nr:hypothetical protein [Actinoplanes abujensis]MBB4698022.1 hypothetical protein [Actinoplanes abujensis]GID19494.1 hypothetical protein Aab01nite_30840 [Actinoplanes abujensis]